MSAVAGTPTFAQVASSREILTGLESANDRFFKEAGTYRLIYARVEATDLVESRASGNMLLAEWTLAHQQGRDWLSRLKFETPRTTETLVIPKEPVVHLVRSGQALDWTPHTGRCAVNPSSGILNVFEGCRLLRDVGLNPYRYMAAAIQADYQQMRARAEETGSYSDLGFPLLPDTLAEHVDDYVVHETELNVHKCILLERKGLDRIWVDPGRGHLVLRRELNWRVDGPARLTVSNTDVRQVAPGIWFPFEQTVEQFAIIDAEEESLWGNLVNRARYQVRQFELNGNVDDLIDVRLPTGTLVDDFVRDLHYTVRPAIDNPFDQSIAAAVADLERVKPRTYWPMIIANVAVLVIGWLVFMRRRSQGPLNGIALAALLLSGSTAGASDEPVRSSSGRATVMADVQPAGITARDAASPWQFEPHWRERGDCGPNALYVFLRLHGRELTLQDVKHEIPIDPAKGCSIEALRAASQSFGVTSQVRFVTPNELKSIPMPFIIHGTSDVEGESGHFSVVVKWDPQTRRFSIIDPVWETYESYTEQFVVTGFSGYVLVRSPTLDLWWSAATMLLLGTVIGLVSFVGVRKGRCIEHAVG